MTAVFSEPTTLEESGAPSDQQVPTVITPQSDILVHSHNDGLYGKAAAVDVTTVKSPDQAMAELQSIERDLKDWFLTRRVLMERHWSLKKLFERYGVAGLNGCPSSTAPPLDNALWGDITRGRPEVEDQLSLDARERKVDMYHSIFANSCDLDHPCRRSGIDYFRCLKINFRAASSDRQRECENLFAAFAQCRKDTMDDEATRLSASWNETRRRDRRAKSLWDRRTELLRVLEKRGVMAPAVY